MVFYDKPWKAQGIMSVIPYGLKESRANPDSRRGSTGFIAQWEQCQGRSEGTVSKTLWPCFKSDTLMSLPDESG